MSLTRRWTGLKIDGVGFEDCVNFTWNKQLDGSEFVTVKLRVRKVDIMTHPTDLGAMDVVAVETVSGGWRRHG